MAEATDINVDELRRRARRRLIGAVVLALAAAVFVPMLLESDPKPLGEDVSVKIPPEDSAKFVNRLSDKGAKSPAVAPAAKSEPAKETAKEPAKSESAKSTAKDPGRNVDTAPADAAPAPAAPPECPPAPQRPPAEEVDLAGRAEDAGRAGQPAVSAAASFLLRRRPPLPPPSPPAAGSTAKPAAAVAAKEPAGPPANPFRCSSPPLQTTRAPMRWPTS